MSLSDAIKQYNPCQEAVLWLDQQSNWQQAWDNCPYCGWMFWLLNVLNLPDPKITVKPIDKWDFTSRYTKDVDSLFREEIRKIYPTCPVQI